MKILHEDKCPNCGVELERVRAGILGTPCGMFHSSPGIARLVIDVVNGERDDILATVTEGKVITETVGDDKYLSVENAVIAVLNGIDEIVFPD